MSENTTNQSAIVPHLIVAGGEAAIDFYVKAFGAEEKFRLVAKDGRLGHAELTIGAARFMLADEYPEQNYIGPIQRGGSSCGLSMQVSDVDAVVARAIEAGAKLERPIENEFFDDRVGSIVDPFGHRWSFHKQLEAVSTETIKKRFAELRDQT